MLKQMWKDLTTGWGTPKDWALGFLILIIVIAAGAVVVGLPIVVISVVFGISTDLSALIVAILSGIVVWAASANERSK